MTQIITEPTVTDNARLLLGFIGGAISVRAGQPYNIVRVQAEACVMMIEHADNGNQYEVSVKQISGVE